MSRAHSYRTVLFLFLLSLSYLVQGQQYSKIFHYSEDYLAAAPSLLLDSNVAYTASGNNWGWKDIIFRSVDRSGALLDSVTRTWTWDSQIVGVSPHEGTLQRLNDSTIVSSIYLIYNNWDSACSQLLLMDNSFNVRDSIRVRENSSTVRVFDLLVEDSTITVTGFVQDNAKYDQDLFIKQYDHSLNLIWSSRIQDTVYYGPNNYHGYTFPNTLTRLGDNYYVSGLSRYPNQTSKGFLIKTDLVGNKVFDKRYQINGWAGMHYGAIPLSNDSLLLPSTQISKSDPVSSSTIWSKWSLPIRDTLGALISDTVYSEELLYGSLKDAQLLDDGNILVTGYYWYGEYKSVMWKLDRQMNTIWRRVYYHGDWLDGSQIFGIGEWGDGGLLGMGFYLNAYNYDTTRTNEYLWLLSLDANGCLDSANCGEGIGVVEWPIDPVEDIVVYPNPTDGPLTIELPEYSKKVYLKIQNINGQLVFMEEYFNTKLIELNEIFPAGTYVVEVMANKVLYTEKVEVL
ncbi:MAG: T9SS C-terminal target domain-containing protein [Bacteroidetes bacterium]|nr:MAG: T9SS C-terminal target domain-containing protein [Bacteroidota bacterium]REK61181.1 MAG: T9SS C-terminal target domain-containing protein [Bacteroidota bacterium]